MVKMSKRVYGVIGIKSVMANWNADFTGYPKSTSDGEVFGSDKALKYPMKKLWQNDGEKVLYIKSYKMDEKENKLRPRSLKERYEQIFNTDDLKNVKDRNEVLKNLFSAIDVKSFGATFAEADNNISITGAVQIAQGFNKYEDSIAEEQQILSPFRDSTKDDADNSTLGTKIVSNEAHYAYYFAINPHSYDEYEQLGLTEGYSEEDYEKFKEAARVSATSFATNSKVGCENEYAIFIETNDNTYLPDLSGYVTFEKVENGKNIISLNFGDIVNSLGDNILDVQIYFNHYTTDIKTNLSKAKYFDLFTSDELNLAGV